MKTGILVSLPSDKTSKLQKLQLKFHKVSFQKLDHTLPAHLIVYDWVDTHSPLCHQMRILLRKVNGNNIKITVFPTGMHVLGHSMKLRWKYQVKQNVKGRIEGKRKGRRGLLEWLKEKSESCL